MDSVIDTPVKRRKTETGHVVGSQGYDSQNDSGDDFLADYETVATVPLPKNQFVNSSLNTPSSPTPYLTQPTQIIDGRTQIAHMSGLEPSHIQVAASSPARSPLVVRSTPTPKTGGILANRMAPPGTTFKLPHGVTKRAPVIDLSDDDHGIQYVGSSDDESQAGADIKPSTFSARSQKISQTKGMESGKQHAPVNGLQKFNEITSKSFYKPLDSNAAKWQGSTLSGSVFDSRNRDESNTTSRIPAPKRSADVMANAYGSVSRPAKQVRQTAPAKAAPVTSRSLDDVEDYSLRQKTKRMQAVVPSYSVDMCYDALITRRGNADDALDYLTSQENVPPEIDLTISDDELTALRPQLPSKPSAKQQLKAPSRTIQEKYTSTQLASRNAPPSPVALPKQRRRLMQGRKNRSSPVPSSPRAETPVRQHATPESVDSDSGIGSEVEENPELEGSLLNFFNTCTVQDLADIAAISEDVAALVIAARPFKNLDQVRSVSSDQAFTKAGNRKKTTTRKPVGGKIVETCERMWTGYEAVDELVKHCEALGKPVAEEMQKWGVNVFGTAKEGELELVSFGDVKADYKSDRSSIRDSGIGTPTSGAVSADEEAEVNVNTNPNSKPRAKPTFFPQPSIMAPGVTLKDYQVVGINWLSLLYEKRLSCILADDMGLGKTCQVIAFLASLFEKGVKGPHLVIVPGSTLENWLREFQTFCPTLHVMPYYAGLKERPGIRDGILASDERPNVIVTTYGIAKVKEDNKFLRKLKPSVCVFDEGHYLKNANSLVYESLIKISADFRLLLTGTPLQNNLEELASLLGFILPSVFREHKEDLESIFSAKVKTTDDSHSALLSAQRISRARSMMTPFILRRKKHQVLKHLPTKTRRVEYCELTTSQRDIYKGEEKRVREILEAREAGVKIKSKETTNCMMNLRKASIHPLLFRRIYDDTTLSKMAKKAVKEEAYQASDVNLVYEDMTVMTDFELNRLCGDNPKHMGQFVLDEDHWMDSGKVLKLCQLLTDFKANGDRVLVFSQFTMVMDILEAVLESLTMKFYRLDGQTDINIRQTMIDEFYEDTSITVFMLSTKAGGAGINLACANKVIIFDSSFNPQDDIQAENRAHRVGQTRDVEVIRLVTKGTIEEHIYRLGETKLLLDDKVAGAGDAEDAAKKAEKAGEKKVQEMLLMEIKGEGAG
ncbi:hypothetical protein MMC30_000146 [Trapelia coarctata]|nr:hypothetical protein [Trapelia coarctata]